MPLKVIGEWAVNGGNGVRVSFCNFHKKMEIARRQSRSSVDNTSNRRAVPAIQHQTELQGDVRERGLDGDR